MPNAHHQRLRHELMKGVATFFEMISNRDSLVSVTDIALSDDEARATILVSVLPEKKELIALEFLKRNLTETRDYLKEHVTARHIPYLSVALDTGEKNRQKIDELLRGE